MESPPRAALSGWPRLGLAGGLLGVFVLTVLPFALARRNPMWGDEGMFGYMAWASHSTGQPLYQVGYDSKPPGIFLLYQAVAAYDAAGVGRARLVVGVLAGLAACLLLYWLATEASLAAGLFAGLTAGLLFVYLPGQLAVAEVPLAFFTTLGFYLLYRGLRQERPARLWLAGTALGAAFAFKQVAAAEVLAAGLVIILWRRLSGRSLTRRPPPPAEEGDELPAYPSPQAQAAREAAKATAARVAILLLGFGTVWGIMLLWLAMSGQFAQFWRATVLWLIAGEYPRNEEGLASALVAFWRYRFVMVQAPALIALLACTPARRAGPEGRSPAREGLLSAVLGLWLVFSSAAFLASGWLADVQTPPCFPPLAGLVGLGFGVVGENLRAWARGWRTVGTALLVGLTLTPLADRYQIRLQAALGHLWARGRLHDDERLGRWLAAQVPPNEKIYVVGVEIPVYLHAQRRAPAPLFRIGLATTPQLQEQLLSDLRRDPPAAVVFTHLMHLRFMQECAQRLRKEFVAGSYAKAETGMAAYEVWLRAKRTSAFSPTDQRP